MRWFRSVVVLSLYSCFLQSICVGGVILFFVCVLPWFICASHIVLQRICPCPFAYQSIPAICVVTLHTDDVLSPALLCRLILFLHPSSSRSSSYACCVSCYFSIFFSLSLIPPSSCRYLDPPHYHNRPSCRVVLLFCRFPFAKRTHLLAAYISHPVF